MDENRGAGCLMGGGEETRDAELFSGIANSLPPLDNKQTNKQQQNNILI